MPLQAYIYRVQPAAASVSYSTLFPATENPLSEGGRWRNGATNGLDWTDMQSGSGIAYASAIVPAQGDAIACVNGIAFSANQFAQATLKVAGGYNPDGSGITHECTLHVRCTIGAHSITTYECTKSSTGSVFIVRWNGILDAIDILSTTDLGSVGVADGQVYKATAIGDVISFYQNAVLICQVTDAGGSKLTSGSPGMGFLPRTGATLSGYAWDDVSAGAS